MKKSSKFILIFTFLFSCIIYWIFTLDFYVEPCTFIIETAVVKSVYYNEGNFRTTEHWTGIASKDSGENVKYLTYEPVDIGSILEARHGCGFINQPFDK